ncbi:hypothetical protein TNCT_717831 [Trichonephila clavata]|uniref:Uncharacterized protein n=1 Tax=Trichonephila clavata TaxID=2740835 RepID=A0A8X6HDV3_TRICU|nr:hypothetical protein TNCT_717831 [Trichonephila clavata]
MGKDDYVKYDIPFDFPSCLPKLAIEPIDFLTVTYFIIFYHKAFWYHFNTFLDSDQPSHFSPSSPLPPISPKALEAMCSRATCPTNMPGGSRSDKNSVLVEVVPKGKNSKDSKRHE